MTLLLANDQLPPRRDAAAGPLQPLAHSLARELEPLLDRDLYFPREKALLSREGGRCARDGTLLDFDPFAPHEHHCPRCGTLYRGELHDRFWIYWYQLWLAERAVHAALLDALLPGERFRGLAEQILDGYAARYADYPNRDNVLGPTRLFFSTYLESIWLLQIAVASDLLRERSPAVAARALDRIVEPSRAIIAEYDEGASNRQVWNNAALLAAARLLGDDAAADAAIHGPSGLVSHLAGGLLPDGTWYEGENYHLFAHRGLWYGVTMAEQVRAVLPPDLVGRFQTGFAAPFMTALPDYTLPSRRDSQYAISLRQWRIAEHCELGFARRDDPALGGALARLYGDDVPRRDTGRWRSSADVERNAPPSALTRADLGWRALLCAKPELPALEAVAPRSVLLPSQGIAVFRRDRARGYIALDYGHSGGGHGHPDRLNLLLVHGTTRWLDDYGTGSYVDRSLHWYRSTLAHNAPLVDGRSQQPASGRLVAYDERGRAGWVSAELDEAFDGVAITRSIVVVDGYLVDTLSWTADRDIMLDLPMHADVELDALPPLEPAGMPGGAGLEDGFRFLQNAHDARVQRVLAGRLVHGAAGIAGDRLELWCRASTSIEWWRAVAPGPPGDGDRAFRVARCHARAGRIQSVLSWDGQVTAVDSRAGDDQLCVALAGGAEHRHRETAKHWRITISAHGASEAIELAGRVAGSGPAPLLAASTAAAPASTPAASLHIGRTPTYVELAEPHYRRSELRWTHARRPAARVALHVADATLHVDIDVSPSARLFAAPNAVNIHDNEHPDINGDGVQLYIDGAAGSAAWTLVPELGSTTVRARSIDARSTPRRVDARWQPTADGYRMEIAIHPPLPELIDVIVNVISPGRSRREGQLVLSGARNEFVYLRGDRHDASRLVRLRFDNE